MNNFCVVSDKNNDIIECFGCKNWDDLDVIEMYQKYKKEIENKEYNIYVFTNVVPIGITSSHSEYNKTPIYKNNITISIESDITDSESIKLKGLDILQGDESK